MYKILYITKYRNLHTEIVRFATEQDAELREIVISSVRGTKEIKKLLKETLENINLNEVDGIICRGSIEKILQELNITGRIPVMSVQFLSATIINMMADVQKRHPEEFSEEEITRVWVISHQPVQVDYFSMETLFHAQVENKLVGLEIPETFWEDIRKKKVNFILAGQKICAEAEARGIHAYWKPDVNEDESIENTIKQMIFVIRLIRQQAERSMMIENIMDYSFEALLETDQAGNVFYYNIPMRKVLRRPPKEIDGRKLWELIPEIRKEDFNKVTQTKENIYGNIVEIREGETAIVNLIPNLQDGTANGAILYLYEKEKVDSLDVTIHQRTQEKGMIARYRFQDILGESEAMKTSVFRARQFARHRANVLILGDSGTGKELFAQSIHNYSARRDQPFVAVNCGALSENLLESELFGYVGGAFTGASRNGKKGLIEQADKGTVFLDEIGEMSLDGQVRLLRVLEERTITRIGDDRQIPVDVRIIAATNRNLREEVRKGKFREDLYYRLNVLTLVIPPLRKRGEDIVLLAERFLSVYGTQDAKEMVLSEGAKDVLKKYPWPGNVRQLRNFCERLVIISNCRVISKDWMISQLQEIYQEDVEGIKSSPIQDVRQAEVLQLETSETIAMGDLDWEQKSEAKRIRAALTKTGGDRNKTAALLGIGRSTLWRKMKKYDIRGHY